MSKIAERIMFSLLAAFSIIAVVFSIQISYILVTLGLKMIFACGIIMLGFFPTMFTCTLKAYYRECDLARV